MSAPDLDALQDAIDRHKKYVDNYGVDWDSLTFAEESYRLIDELFREVRRLRVAMPSILLDLVRRANTGSDGTHEQRAGEVYAYLTVLDLINDKEVGQDA